LADDNATTELATAAPAPRGVLYIVATPLGNLEDVSARALRILREADLIAAEDTRVTRKLLAHFDIHTPLVAYHAHSSDRRSDDLLNQLRAGKQIALVSDAGTPAISDPGAELVAAAIEAGVRVEPIPGPSAVIAALVASGLPPARFVFEGFLPRTRGDRWERVREVCREPRTVVLYEAPTRLVETLEELIKAAGGQRRVVVAREVTKKFEEFRRGTLVEVAAHFRAHTPRGECTVILEGTPEKPGGADQDDAADPEALLKDALARGQSPRDAARDVARVTGLPRNEVYALVLRLTQQT
jgi:16S rRNA (cytidine1402-2'-O)-methyltransferase